MKKIIVFDFDKTLTDFDTTFPFFIYCAKRRPVRLIMIPFFLSLMICVKLKLLSVRRLKEIGVKLFCPLYLKEFKRISKDYSKTISLNKIYHNEFLKIVNSDAKIIIASASFEYYLTDLFKNVKFVATTLKISPGSGRITGINQHPFREMKKKILINMGYNYIDKFYTDSEHDLYTSSISRETIWIKRGEITRIQKNEK